MSRGPVDPNTPDGPRTPDPMAANVAARLLSMSIGGPARPVEGLILRLQRPDGLTWFRHAVAKGTGLTEHDIEPILAGTIELQKLKQAKSFAKKGMGSATTADSGLTSTVGYLVAVAAALRNHHTFISGRPREEVDRVLIDLAELLPKPWSDLFLEAAAAPIDRPGSNDD